MEGPPPSYEAATAGSSANRPAEPTLRPPQTRNGIPPINRRSMEDESRPLPHGWIRLYDSKSSHQFYVDETSSPPRSIWQHPYDDEQYLKSLDPPERARVKGLHRVPTIADVEAESSDDEHHHHSHPQAPTPVVSDSEPRGSVSRFGRKMKDKITNSTHEQREEARRRRAEEEQRAYARHQAIRQAMSRAIETGQPQLIGKDHNGKDLYIEPPPAGLGMSSGGFGGGGGGGYGFGGGGGAYGYNPYAQGPYRRTAGNATYVRPEYPYSRPYGGGYGGGYGLPLAAGLGGGLLGGLLLGDVMGGDMMGGGMF